MSDMFPSPLERKDYKPLSKGMVTTVPSTTIPDGSFYSIKDMYVTPNGLQRRNSWRMFFPTKVNFGRIPIQSDEIVSDIEGFFDKNNNLQLLAFTNKRLYVNKIGEGFESVAFGQALYTITTVAAGSVTCSAANFTADSILAGDIAAFEITPGVWTETPISAVISTTQLNLTTPAGVTTSTPLKLIREFSVNDQQIVDFTFAPSSIIIVDGTPRGIWRYDGDKMYDMKVHGSADDITDGNEFYLKGAKTVYFFNGYIMLGNTTENYSGSGGVNNKFDQKRTLRWSSISDVTEFAVIDYVLFTQESSEVEKITASEECPIIFLSNGIYFGTPSDLAGLPYKYARIETGAISAIGPRAMAPVPGGMVFIAQKNIYFMELARQGTRVPVLTPIGNEIYNKANYENNGPIYSRVLFSPQQNLLYCTFPRIKKRLGRMFAFSGETKAWSYVEDESSRFTCANVFPYYLLLRWQDNTTQDWTDYDVQSWFSLKLEDYTSRVFTVDTAGYVYVSDDSYEWDEAPDGFGDIARVPYQCVVESGDIDFGSPGHYKILTQMILTVGDVATKERNNDITCNIQISVDRGKTWLDKADITIEDDTFVEDAHIRANGEVIRYRLTFGANAPLFTLAELQLRFRRVGSFVQRGP